MDDHNNISRHPRLHHNNKINKLNFWYKKITLLISLLLFGFCGDMWCMLSSLTLLLVVLNFQNPFLSFSSFPLFFSLFFRLGRLSGGMKLKGLGFVWCCCYRGVMRADGGLIKLHSITIPSHLMPCMLRVFKLSFLWTIFGRIFIPIFAHKSGWWWWSWKSDGSRRLCSIYFMGNNHNLMSQK